MRQITLLSHGRFVCPRALPLLLLAATALFVAGCSESDTTSPQNGGQAGQASEPATPTEEEKADTHTGWWCVEHGIPEAECSMCSQEVATECKAKSDWCEEHDRAASQCFVCSPELQEKFAARYEAKFGKKPPSQDSSGS